MGEQLSVLVPPRVTAPAGLRVAPFSVELPDNPYATGGWARRCRVDNLVDDRDRQIVADFHRGGLASLPLPADVGGEVVLVFEFAHSATGRRLSGALTVRVDRHESTGAVHVHAEGHHAEGSGVVYQPIEVKASGAQSLEVVGDKLLARVPLFEDPEGERPLADVVEREEVLVLSDRGDNIARVLSVDLGHQLLLGRCYRDQLHERARARVDLLRQERVHWVTCWDDPGLNQITALLSYRLAETEDRLAIHNLTDYSVRRQTLTVAVEGEAPREVRPGETHEVTLAADRAIELRAGEGTGRPPLARLEFDEIPFGGSAVPLLRSVDTTFLYPPTGGREAQRIHFLGAWIPWPTARLKDLLATRDEPLPVSFPRDDLFLQVRFRRRERYLALSGNIDLRSCLGAR